MGMGGGGAYLNNRDQINNVVMIRYASSEDRAECPTYGVSQMGTTFNRVWESVARAEGASLWGGSQKILKSESLKTPFSAFSSQ